MIYTSEFEGFQKIARLRRECVVTEKIDGTNAHVVVPEDDGPLLVGSRNRYITPDSDNFGFARFVADNEGTFRALGPGRHYGEWWGSGIQRRYGLNEKRFSLFNTSRWTDETVPTGLHVVPVLYSGVFSTTAVDDAILTLATGGSLAAPGFYSPEGVVVWHEAARQFFKVTLGGDGAKGAR